MLQHKERNLKYKIHAPPYINVSPSEAAAWLSTKEQSKQCSAGIQEPYPRDKMMQISQCFTDILNAKVKPVVVSDQAYQKYMKERIAAHKKYATGDITWDELMASSTKRVDDYFKTAKGGSYFNYASCANDILSREVFPSYQYKPLLTEYMTNMASFARKADKERMAREDFIIGEQQVWNDFANKEQSVISQYQAQSAAASQQAFQNLSTMQQIENQRAEANRASMPQIRNTNCRAVGNSMNCTTW